MMSSKGFSVTNLVYHRLLAIFYQLIGIIDVLKLKQRKFNQSINHAFFFVYVNIDAK